MTDIKPDALVNLPSAPMVDAEYLEERAFENFNRFIKALRMSYTDLYITTLEYDNVTERESEFANDVRQASDFLDIVDESFLGYFLDDIEFQDDIDKLKFLLKFHVSVRHEFKRVIDDYGTNNLLAKVVDSIYKELNDDFSIVYAF